MNLVQNKIEISNLKQIEVDSLVTMMNTREFFDYISPQPIWMKNKIKDGVYSEQLVDGFIVITVPGGKEIPAAWRRYHWGPEYEFFEGDFETTKNSVAGSFETAMETVNRRFICSFLEKFPSAQVTIKYMDESDNYYGVIIADMKKVAYWCSEAQLHADLYGAWDDDLLVETGVIKGWDQLCMDEKLIALEHVAEQQTIKFIP